MPIYAQFPGKTVMVTIAMARKKMVNQVKKIAVWATDDPPDVARPDPEQLLKSSFFLFRGA
jgi:hypothetical protein